MRKIIYISSGIALGLMIALLLVSRIAESAQLVVATDPTLPPFEYIGGEEGDTISGFDIEVARKVAQNTRMRLRIESMPFGGLLPAVEEGRVDFAIAAIPITDTWEERIDFSEPYYAATQTIVAREGEAAIRTVDDLRQKRVAVLAETIGEMAVEELGVPVAATVFRESAAMLEALAAGQVDALIADREAARYWVRHSGGALTIAEARLPAIRYGVAVRAGNTALLDVINRTIRNMRDNGEYDALLRRYIVL